MMGMTGVDIVILNDPERGDPGVILRKCCQFFCHCVPPITYFTTNFLFFKLPFRQRASFFLLFLLPGIENFFSVQYSKRITAEKEKEE